MNRTDWQPIETSPDDRPVLVCDKWDRIFVAQKDSRGDWYPFQSPSIEFPEYWTPLPELPK